MKLSHVIVGTFIICVLLLGATYMLSRNQNDQDNNALNVTRTTTSNTTTINSANIMNNSTKGSEINNVTSMPTNEPAKDITDTSPDNGYLNIYYCIQYGTDKYVKDANVTLYKEIGNNETTNEPILVKVDIPGNPLHTTNTIIHGTPAYKFNNLPYGDYIIRAEKDGKILASKPYPITSESVDCVFYIIIDNPDCMIPDSCHPDKNMIYGWVKNMNGDYLANVKVSLLRQQSRADISVMATDIKNNPTHSAAGEHSGFYSFENVTPGWYTITIDYQGHSYNSTVKFPGDNKDGMRTDLTYYR